MSAILCWQYTGVSSKRESPLPLFFKFFKER
jgi:hypothetical protein